MHPARRHPQHAEPRRSVYHQGGTLGGMVSSHPRVQVTVYPEFAAAMAALDPHPASRSRLLRDLAIRGAEPHGTIAPAVSRPSSTY